MTLSDILKIFDFLYLGLRTQKIPQPYVVLLLMRWLRKLLISENADQTLGNFCGLSCVMMYNLVDVVIFFSTCETRIHHTNALVKSGSVSSYSQIIELYIAQQYSN